MAYYRADENLPEVVPDASPEAIPKHAAAQYPNHLHDQNAKYPVILDDSPKFVGAPNPSPPPFSAVSPYTETLVPGSPFGGPPPAESQAPAKTMCGLRKRNFWILFVLVLVVLAAALGGGIGGGLAANKGSEAAASAGSDGTDQGEETPRYACSLAFTPVLQTYKTFFQPILNAGVRNPTSRTCQNLKTNQRAPSAFSPLSAVNLQQKPAKIPMPPTRPHPRKQSQAHHRHPTLPRRFASSTKPSRPTRSPSRRGPRRISRARYRQSTAPRASSSLASKPSATYGYPTRRRAASPFATTSACGAKSFTGTSRADRFLASSSTATGRKRRILAQSDLMSIEEEKEIVQCDAIDGEM